MQIAMTSISAPMTYATPMLDCVQIKSLRIAARPQRNAMISTHARKIYVF
jgi:hypothetical protein